MATESPALPLHRAGAVVKIQGELRFLPARLLRRFVPSPTLSNVSGTGLTMALVDGQVLAVIAMGASSGALAICEVGGEQVGLVGVSPVDVGFFVADGAGVSFRGKRVAPLDVVELVKSTARGTVERAEVES